MNARPLEWARENAAEAKCLMNLLRKQPEDAASFKPDLNTNIEAMQLIEARMAELGVEL
jgi:hypothetical protein